MNKTLIARALSLAFVTGVASTVFVSPAYSQSNTTGVISGQIESPAGASVVIEGAGSGIRRTLTPDAGGHFRALSLPPGDYKVMLMRAGKVEKIEDATVSIGAGTNVSFEAIQRIEITGGRASRIDVSNTNLGASFTARELANLPIAPTIGAVIQLAPSTIEGDRRYGGSAAPVFGGSSASENAYYINGFPVTNPLSQVGYLALPFGAIGETQILSGGYGAEFGRSTGGVVNITTKRGTNTWEAGVAVQWEPESLRATRQNIVYPMTTPTNARAGTMRQRMDMYKEDDRTYSGYFGGPLIKDKLFLFFAAEQKKLSSRGVDRDITSPLASSVGWEDRNSTTDRYLAKLDWNLTDAHHLEWTHIDDSPKDHRDYYGYNYATGTHGSVRNLAIDYQNWGPIPIAAAQGGKADIFKYTGELTQDLTLTALYGKLRTERRQSISPYDPTLPLVTVTDSLNPITGAQNVSDDQLTPGAFSTNKGYRLDLEWKFNDKHTLRGGLDKNKLESYAGFVTSGGTQYDYGSDSCNQALALPGGPIMNSATVLNDGAGTCYYVRQHTFKAINPANVDQSAWYVEDRWNVTNKLLLVLGLRSEGFKNYNDVGQVFVEQKNQLEPRIAASFDVNGDGKTKLFGSVGRYHLQLPANVAVRGAGSSTYIDQYFTYKGVDAKGLPTGTTALTGAFSPDGETGAAKPLGYVAAQNLDSHYQDELALGIEKAFSKELNMGAKLTYRKLKGTLEDWCDPRPFIKWADDRGMTHPGFRYDTLYPGGSLAFACAVINPGKTNTFDLDINQDGKLEHIVLTPKDMAGGESTADSAVMPEAKRRYIALDFFAEHPFDGNWYGKINWTLSSNKGSTEGQLNSDLGQADPATTIAYDFKELTEYSYGRLPNDRRHVIKAFGYYQLNTEWRIGANAMIASGRPKSCLGSASPADTANNLGYQAYGTLLFYCNGLPAPRGSFGELPWQKRLDLNFTYRPGLLPGVQLSMDIFNVFNRQEAQQERERETPSNRKWIIESYTAPRYMRFTMQYDKKF